MNQRNFFKSLALIGAGAAACPGIFIPKFEPVVWKRSVVSAINPEWVNAQYQWSFIVEELKVATREIQSSFLIKRAQGIRPTPIWTEEDSANLAAYNA